MISNLKIKRCKLKLLLLVTMGFGLPLTAQEETETDSLDIFLDEFLLSEQELFLDDIFRLNSDLSFISTGLVFNNKTYFNGRTSDLDLYNFSPQINYFHSSGINLSAASTYFKSYDPNWALSSFSIGYLNFFDKKKLINYSVNYSRLFYADGDKTLNNSIDIALGFDSKNRYFGSEISLNYIFGSERVYQLNWSIYSRVTLYHGRDYVIRILPGISLLGAVQKVEYYTFDMQGNQTGVYSEDLDGLSNTRLSLPIYYSNTYFFIELGYHINFPRAMKIEGSLPNTSYFSARLFYMIDL